MCSGADYEIDDPRLIAASAPYTFFLPSLADVSAVRDGDLIKAAVRTLPPSNEWDAERLWFVVIGMSDDAFVARLESEPYDMPNFPKGRVVDIPRQAVVDIIPEDGRSREPAPREYWDRCLVDGSVLSGQRPVDYIYREEPDTPSGAEFPDSGWRIRASTSGISAAEAENDTVEYVALGAVLNKDDSWLHLIDAPIGSAFYRDFEQNSWVEDGG